MEIKYCEECGTPFYREPHEHWKCICLECWKKKKRLESSSTQYTINHRLEIERLRRENSNLLRLAQENPIEMFVRDNIKTLLMLCHPDKHGNHKAATLITQKLIEIKAQPDPGMDGDSKKM